MALLPRQLWLGQASMARVSNEILASVQPLPPLSISTSLFLFCFAFWLLFFFYFCFVYIIRRKWFNCQTKPNLFKLYTVIPSTLGIYILASIVSPIINWTLNFEKFQIGPWFYGNCKLAYDFQFMPKCDSPHLIIWYPYPFFYFPFLMFKFF